MGKNKAAETVKKTKTELVLRAIQPLSTEQHKQLSNKLRYEEEKSGLKIVLLPYSTQPADGFLELQEELASTKAQLEKALEENKALQVELAAKTQKQE